MNKKYGFAMCIGLLLMSVCVFGVTAAAAQDYPKGPIQLVVPFGPRAGPPTSSGGPSVNISPKPSRRPSPSSTSPAEAGSSGWPAS